VTRSLRSLATRPDDLPPFLASSASSFRERRCRRAKRSGPSMGPPRTATRRRGEGEKRLSSSARLEFAGERDRRTRSIAIFIGSLPESTGRSRAPRQSPRQVRALGLRVGSSDAIVAVVGDGSRRSLPPFLASSASSFRNVAVVDREIGRVDGSPWPSGTATRNRLSSAVSIDRDEPTTTRRRDRLSGRLDRLVD
jgi:hypothetical protein